MEALAFGVPPIIMDNELGHELFDEYAFYSKNGEIDEIADAIQQALTQSDKIQNKCRITQSHTGSAMCLLQRSGAR